MENSNLIKMINSERKLILREMLKQYAKNTILKGK